MPNCAPGQGRPFFLIEAKNAARHPLETWYYGGFLFDEARQLIPSRIGQDLHHPSWRSARLWEYQWPGEQSSSAERI
ncbi:MAG TPA: hypothetical protein VE136_05190 [Anaerolineales bacterium]|nr:hypothetical protein [Anaerolineales bacterium]